MCSHSWRVPLTVWGNVDVQVTQDICKRFDASVTKGFQWNFLWNVAQVLPLLCGLLLLLRPVHRNRHVLILVLAVAVAFGLVKGAMWMAGGEYNGWTIANANTYTYLMSVAFLWLYADVLGRQRAWARVLLVVVMLLACALFGRVCFEAGDIQGGLFNSSWARNLTGAGCLFVAGLVGRLLIFRRARRGKGRIALLVLMFAIIILGANGVLVKNTIQRAHNYGGMSFGQAWNIFYAVESQLALCTTLIMMTLMAIPLLSSVYRKRFDVFFGINAPETGAVALDTVDVHKEP